MADRAHDMRLIRLLIDGIAHGFAIDGQALVDLAILGIPGAECAIQLSRIDTDQGIADHRAAGHFVVPLAFATTESTARLLAQRLDPDRDVLVTAHAAQDSRGRQRQDTGQGVLPALGAARIIDLGEKSVQREHLFGTQLHAGLSCVVAFIESGARQQAARIALQGQNENQLGEGRAFAVAVAGASVALGLADQRPVCGVIEGAVETRWIDKSLQHQQRKAKTLPPVVLNPAAQPGQYLRGQVAMVAARQDQKPGIIGHQIEAIVLVAVVPADPAITRRTFEGGGGNAQ